MMISSWGAIYTMVVPEDCNWAEKVLPPGGRDGKQFQLWMRMKVKSCYRSFLLIWRMNCWNWSRNTWLKKRKNPPRESTVKSLAEAYADLSKFLKMFINIDAKNQNIFIIERNISTLSAYKHIYNGKETNQANHHEHFSEKNGASWRRKLRQKSRRKLIELQVRVLPLPAGEPTDQWQVWNSTCSAPTLTVTA